jgi:SpoVK/Ycf46/Vps4 family AAA+-type ATPase
MLDPSVSAHYTGDCRKLLKQLPAGCVQTCVTSPPYWGLRDYDTEGQIGLEDTPEEYVIEMVEVFQGVWRALKDGRAIVFFDEADALMQTRTSGNEAAAREMARTVNSLLMMFEESCPSLLVCATNRQDMIDPAMWRRFDEVLEFPAPTGIQAAALLKRCVSRHLPTAVIPDMRSWAKRLSGLSYADVERLATNAVKATVVQDWSLRAALAWSLENQQERRRALRTTNRRS